MRCSTLYRDFKTNLFQRTNDVFKAVSFVCGGIMLRNAYIKLKRKVSVQKVISRCKWYILLIFEAISS